MTDAIAPLDDPAYVPQHPPVNGTVPDVVAKWGPRSQRRWFRRYNGQLQAMPHSEWARFYCSSEEHRGLCCGSCLDDDEMGYGSGIDECCCYALKEKMTP